MVNSLGDRYRDVGNAAPVGWLVSPGMGHCVTTVSTQAGTPAQSAVLMDYYRGTVLPEMEERLGPRVKTATSFVGTVFPNFSWLRVANTIRVWHPRGPDKMEIWNWCVVDRAAPPEIKDTMRKELIRTFSPGGVFEQDDAENWQYCVESSKARSIRNYPMNYTAKLSGESYNEDLAGITSKRPSESVHRHFYAHWARMLSGTSWQDIMKAEAATSAVH